MKKVLILFLISFSVFSQSVEITPGNVLPQVTTAQRNAIASPKNGMLVFDTNTQSYWFRQSGNWTELPKSGSTSNYWQLTGNVINNTNSGGFWSANPIGLSSNINIALHPPTAPVSGDGTRLMWIPSRSAFRVGTVADGTKSWDADSIGLFSTAIGYNSKARGVYSTAIGFISNSRGTGTIAMGSYATARGSYSTAIGFNSTASGNYSSAIGHTITASGLFSTAMGNNVDASRKGTFFIGDSRTTERPPVNWDDQFLAAFYHGYVLQTRNGGVSIGGGQTAWSSLSDSTKKENFVKANGEEFLSKLSKLKLGSWNYKGNETRNYGPMAQEIFTAFGKDKLGTIGSDTLVNTLDMDGLLFIFAQALEEKTEALKNNLKAAQEDIKQLLTHNEKLDAHISTLTLEITHIKEQFRTLLEESPETDNKLISQKD